MHYFDFPFLWLCSILTSKLELFMYFFSLGFSFFFYQLLWLGFIGFLRYVKLLIEICVYMFGSGGSSYFCSRVLYLIVSLVMLLFDASVCPKDWEDSLSEFTFLRCGHSPLSWFFFMPKTFGVGKVIHLIPLYVYTFGD